RQRWNVCSLTSKVWQAWPIVLPAASIASASRSFLIICSGLCFFLFIESLLARSGPLDSHRYHLDQVLGSIPVAYQRIAWDSQKTNPIDCATSRRTFISQLSTCRRSDAVFEHSPDWTIDAFRRDRFWPHRETKSPGRIKVLPGL